jgi:ankyrin repeat protein
VNVTVRDQTTALWLASSVGCVVSLKLLLEAGARAEVKREVDGLSSLQLAIQEGHSKATQLLMAAAAKRSKTLTELIEAQGSSPDQAVSIAHGPNPNISTMLNHSVHNLIFGRS